MRFGVPGDGGDGRGGEVGALLEVRHLLVEVWLGWGDEEVLLWGC